MIIFIVCVVAVLIGMTIAQIHHMWKAVLPHLQAQGKRGDTSMAGMLLWSTVLHLFFIIYALVCLIRCVLMP